MVEAPEESVEVDTVDGTYTVTLAETENGSISFAGADGNTAQFAEGDEVEVDIAPDEGYGFSKITLALTDTGEIAAEDSDKDAASYTFTMPAADLTVSAEFAKEAETVLNTDKETFESANGFLDYAMLDAMSKVVPTYNDPTGIMTLASEYTYLEKGDSISYGYWSTHIYRTYDNGTDENGNIAYCVQPSYRGPDSNDYQKHYDLENYVVAGEGNEAARATVVRNVLWYSYGSPGFDASLWPSTWYDGTEMTSRRYYVLAHTLLADAMLRDGDAALYGCTDTFKSWFFYEVAGWEGSDHVNENSTFDKIAYSTEVPDGFEPYIMITGSTTQMMIGWDYTPIETGYLTLKKSSSNSSITDGNSCYDMTNITFDVQDETGGTIGHLTCDENGNTDTLELEAGTYTIIEDESSLKGTGYLMSDESNINKPGQWEVEITSDNTEDNPYVLEVSDPPGNDPAGIEIYKESSEGTGPSLAGAEFTVRYFDGYYDDESSLPGEATRTWVIKTVESDGKYRASLLDSNCFVSGDELYYSDSGNVVLPLGTIAITETKPADGYLIDGTFTSGDKTYSAGETYVAQITSDGKAVSTSGGNTLEVTDKLIRGGVAVQKRDSQSLLTDPQGSGSFEGITMQITNDNDRDVIVNGTTYGPGEVVKTLVTDENGYAATDSDTLPYGTYTIAETEIPVTDGYLDGSESHDSVSSVTSIQFDVEEDGVIVDLTGADNSVTDLVKRGDISLVKQDGDTQETMGPVEFEITSLTTGESHDFWTDENGDYSSDSTWNRHSYHTNEAEDEYSGLWFYGYADGEASGVEVDDSLGALPYDTYRLDELPCEANEGKELVHTTFTITRDVRTISLGTIDNYDLETPEPYLHSMAYAKATGTQLCYADGYETLIDDCFYYNLTPGVEYYLLGVAYDVDTGEPETDHYGETISATTTFTPTESDGVEEQEFYFDVEDLSGHKVTFYERIYTLDENGEYVLVCAEPAEDYENESIYFPQLGTTLLDEATGTHYSIADGEITLVDTVAVSEVPQGTTVMVTGTLMKKSTGEAVIGSDGNPVTASETFVSTGIEEQFVEISFTFDASELDGDGVVAFEDLYQITDEEEGTGPLVGKHADINDEGQTVTFPGIHTTATDSKTGTHTSNASESTTIIDEVEYTGLNPGEEYTMTGTLMDKDTGKELLDSNGNTVTSEVTFTPETADGSIEMEFTFDSSALAGTTIVVFEDLYQNGELVATHSDLTDVAQTVYIPVIGTTATDAEDGDQYINNTEATINDEVHYVGLEPGRNYRMSGTLIDKSTGEAVADTVEVDFTPETAEGYVTVPIEVDATNYAGEELVVFETCYELNNSGIYVEVASHEDINDAGQTIYVLAPEEVPADHPIVKTGESNMAAVIAIIGCIAAAAIVVVVVVTVRRRRRAV